MDAVTHMMAGVVISSAVAVKKEDQLYPLLLTGALASVICDFDGAMKPFVDYNAFRVYHRVFTHNLFVLPVLAALAALPAWI